METKVQKMYREALAKGDVVGAIKLLHYKPNFEDSKKPVEKKVEVVVEEEVVVVVEKPKKNMSKKEIVVSE